jgi:PEP-CTERM motif
VKDLLGFSCVFGDGRGLCAERAGGYVITFENVGPDVVEVGGGTLDLTGFTLSRLLIQPIIFLLSFDAGSAFATVYKGNVSGIAGGWGTGFAIANVSSEDHFLFNAIGTEIGVPTDYIFGAPLAQTATFNNQSLTSLGLVTGTYVYSWGAGIHADTLTVQICVAPPPAVPEPSTWAMMLIGFAGLGFAAVRHKSAVRAISA